MLRWRLREQPQNERLGQPERRITYIIRTYVHTYIHTYIRVPGPGLPGGICLTGLLPPVHERLRAPYHTHPHTHPHTPHRHRPWSCLALSLLLSASLRSRTVCRHHSPFPSSCLLRSLCSPANRRPWGCELAIALHHSLSLPRRARSSGSGGGSFSRPVTVQVCVQDDAPPAAAACCEKEKSKVYLIVQTDRQGWCPLTAARGLAIPTHST